MPRRREGRRLSTPPLWPLFHTSCHSTADQRSVAAEACLCDGTTGTCQEAAQSVGSNPMEDLQEHRLSTPPLWPLARNSCRSTDARRAVAAESCLCDGTTDTCRQGPGRQPAAPAQPDVCHRLPVAAAAAAAGRSHSSGASSWLSVLESCRRVTHCQSSASLGLLAPSSALWRS